MASPKCCDAGIVTTIRKTRGDDIRRLRSTRGRGAGPHSRPRAPDGARAGQSFVIGHRRKAAGCQGPRLAVLIPQPVCCCWPLVVGCGGGTTNLAELRTGVDQTDGDRRANVRMDLAKAASWQPVQPRRWTWSSNRRC